MQNQINRVLLGQYEAAISMLRDAIASCPPAQWDANVARLPARVVAFHTLYWTDVYLSRSREACVPHELGAQGRGVPFGTPLPEGTLPPGLTQAQSLAYADFCIEKARRVLGAETEADLAGDSGFGEPFTRAEMHIYNIRHVQHHAGALGAHIRRLAPDFPEEGLGWVSSGVWRGE